MTTAAVHNPHPHAEDTDTVGNRWRSGVLLLILADAAFVAALLFTYLYLRGLNTDNAWVADGQKTASIALSWITTGVIVISAVVYRQGERAIRAGNAGQLRATTAGALAVLLVAMVLQLVQWHGFGFGLGDSAYSSSIYVLAAANTFHLLLTLFLGIGILNRTRLGLYTKDDHWQVRVVGFWWTWITLAAVAASLVTSFVYSPNHGG